MDLWCPAEHRFSNFCRWLQASKYKISLSDTTRINWQDFLDLYWPVTPVNVKTAPFPTYRPGQIATWKRSPPRAQIVCWRRLACNNSDQVDEYGYKGNTWAGWFRLQRKARNPEHPAVPHLLWPQSIWQNWGNVNHLLCKASKTLSWMCRRGSWGRQGLNIRVFGRGLRRSWFPVFSITLQ